MSSNPPDLDELERRAQAIHGCFADEGDCDEPTDPCHAAGLSVEGKPQ